MKFPWELHVGSFLHNLLLAFFSSSTHHSKLSSYSWLSKVISSQPCFRKERFCGESATVLIPSFCVQFDVKSEWRGTIPQSRNLDVIYLLGS